MIENKYCKTRNLSVYLDQPYAGTGWRIIRSGIYASQEWAQNIAVAYGLSESQQ